MTGLYLLAAHLVGDFILQSRGMAARKLDEWTVRLCHVMWYLCPFLTVVVWHEWGRGGSHWRAIAFLYLLGLLHFLTDSRRFHSTLMDYIEWRLDRTWIVRDHFGRLTEVRTRLAPNPWPPTSIVVDQALHVCQLAVVAGILLA